MGTMIKKRQKLFCLPCAGGSSSYFLELRERLSPFMDVILIDYPGHGTRMSEPLYDNLEALLQDTAKLIRSQADDENYCILGYSMGSLLAYLLSSDPAYGIKPSHMFLCAFQSPDLLKEKRFLLSDAASEEAFITKYGNIDERILRDPRFAEVFTKPLKNDFHCLTNYEAKALAPVPCGITVIYGNEDYALADVEGWKRFTTQKTEIHSVPGTHFFLNECLDQVCEIMKQNCK